MDQIDKEYFHSHGFLNKYLTIKWGSQSIFKTQLFLSASPTICVRIDFFPSPSHTVFLKIDLSLSVSPNVVVLN